MVHAIYSLLTKKEVNVVAIIYHVIILEARNSSSSQLLPYDVMITHLLEIYGVTFPEDATTLKQGAEIRQSTIRRMLREGTHSKKQKTSFEVGPSTTTVSPPPVDTEVLPPAAKPTAPLPPPAPVAP